MLSEKINAVRFDDIRGAHVLAALSGGADSVALLHLLARRRTADSLRITAAHFNHRIRGEAADADAAFCRALCSRLGIELIEGSADIPSIAQARGTGIETTAREERYRFLQAAQEKCGADCIALAHHLDDQAETVLMHLLRGAGPEGVCGMRRISGRLYRPLLDLQKQELVAFLKSENIPWREDATNALSDTPRNALRLNALPAIEKCYTKAAQAIARYAHAAQIESDYIARQTDAFLASHLECGPYGKRILLSPMPEPALLRRGIRRVCGTDLTAEKLEEIFSLCLRKRGKTQVFQDLYAEKTPGAIYFLPKQPQKIMPRPFNANGKNLLEGLACILAEPGKGEIKTEDPMSELLDAASLQGACLRTRREGDRFHPLGAPGDRLLSDYLTDRKIDRPLRDFLPVLAIENRILWIGGVGISETAKLRSDSRASIQITIIPITNEQAEVK